MVYAGILAAGMGTRMHRQDMPKQFLPLGEKPIIINTLEQFYVNPVIDKVIVVVPNEWKLFTEDLLSQYDTMGTEVKVITGGENKTESVKRIVEYLNENFEMNSDDIIITHDAVRPFVTGRIINENIESAQKYGIASTLMVTNDTMVVSEDGDTIQSIPRKQTIFAEQTPLTFKIQELVQIFREADEAGVKIEKETELARLCINLGRTIHIVRGENQNMKIITPYDLEVANALLREKKV